MWRGKPIYYTCGMAGLKILRVKFYMFRHKHHLTGLLFCLKEGMSLLGVLLIFSVCSGATHVGDAAINILHS
jgi:hypothetical protein